MDEIIWTHEQIRAMSMEEYSTYRDQLLLQAQQANNIQFTTHSHSMNPPDHSHTFNSGQFIVTGSTPGAHTHSFTPGASNWRQQFTISPQEFPPPELTPAERLADAQRRLAEVEEEARIALRELLRSQQADDD